MEFDRPGFDREVGLRLQRARKAAGKTQGEVAERIGIPRASYANIESGRQRVPVDILWRAAIVLDTSINALAPQPERPKRNQASVVPIRRSLLDVAAGAAVGVGSATAVSSPVTAPSRPYGSSLGSQLIDAISVDD
jgi:DNA-binding XRE family transcriptional regulator